MTKILTTIIALLLALPCYAIDLQDATLADIISQRPDLVQSIKAGEDEGYTTISVEKDAQGRRAKWTEFRYDADDNLIGKRVDTYSYYETGEVNTINQKTYRGETELRLERDVKHFTDNKRPKVTTKLECVRNQYYGLVSKKTGKLIPPNGVTILCADEVTVSSLDTSNKPDGMDAFAMTTYREEDVYDKKTGEVIDTEIVTIPGSKLFATLESDGSYVLSGKPEDWLVAIIYFGERKVEAVPIKEKP